MRTPATILSCAMTAIEQRAQADLLKPEEDTVRWIAQRAREALQEASSAELVRVLEAALAEARKR